MGNPKSSTSVDTPITVLPEGYKPSANEEFMNDRQREYFRQKLLAWRAELLDEVNQTIANLSTESLHKPDQMDGPKLKARPRLTCALVTGTQIAAEDKSALRRIEDGTFGYCTETMSRSAWPV